MLNKSVRVPKGLLDEIDKYVYEKRYYATRADFVLSGIRQLIYTYAEKKREVSNQMKSPVTKEIIEQIFRSVTNVYLYAFNKYDGESTQINFRVPEGLNDQISLLLKREYGYDKKADFPRAGITCLLTYHTEVDDILANTEKFMEDQLKLREDVYKIVMDGLKNNLSGPEILNDAIQKLTSSDELSQKK